MPSISFSYTGGEQTWVVPTGVTAVQVDIAGSWGGLSSNGTSADNFGLGGRLQATLAVTPGETLYVRVGGRGTAGAGTVGGTGGYFGGARGGNGAVGGSTGSAGGGGGGATDVRRGGNADSNRVLVAGGGGGQYNSTAARNSAANGGNTLHTEATSSASATQGADVTGLQNGGGGGGGGWVGGAGGGAGALGNGGSSMAHSTQASSPVSTAGFREGEGYATITWTDPAGAGTRSIPAPQYTSTTQQSGANKRTLTSTSPGSTDSTATVGAGSGGVSDNGDYARPEQSSENDGNRSPLAVGTAKGYGWAMATLNASEPHTISAGTWTVVVHYSRPGGLLTADRPAQFTAILFRANSALSSFPQEIGRTTAAQVTLTTSEQSQTINITGAAAAMAAGDRIWLEIHVFLPVQLVAADVWRIHTNSSTASRVTAMPAYSIQYSRGLSDSAGASDSITRVATYARAISDNAGSVTDAIARAVTMPRALADAAGAADALSRQSVYNRALADSAALTEQLTRQATYYRSLMDGAGISEALARQAAYGRSLSDNAGNVTDSLARVVTANRSLADSAAASDSLSRQAAYLRGLADSAGAVDTLQRQMIYARALQDALSEGGGNVTYNIRPIMLQDD